MRIWYASSKGYGGGAAVQMLELARSMAGRGHDILALAPAGKGWEARCEAVSVPFAPVDFKRARAVFTLAGLILRGRPDVIHVQKGRELSLVGLLRPLLLRCVVVANRGVSFPLSRMRALRYRLVADAVVAVSAAVKEVLVSAGVPASRIHVIYGSFDEERFRPDGREADVAAVREELNIASGAPVVVMVANVYRHKGFDTLVAAAERVLWKNARVRFICVGGGDREYRSELKNDIAKRGLSGSITFTGFRDDVPSFLAAADLVVSCSPAGSEGLCGAVREALAMGRPVVATDAGGNRELVREGETGRLIAPGDPEVLAGAVLDLLRDRERAAALGAAGRRFVLGCCTNRQRAGEVERLYGSLLAARRGRPQ